MLKIGGIKATMFNRAAGQIICLGEKEKYIFV